MPYSEDDDRSIEELRAEQEALIALGERAPAGSALRRIAEQTAAGGLWPENPKGTPIVLDTDIGGDPDDAIAVAAAGRTLPELALVLTNDETGGDLVHGERARLARHLLDLLGRGDVGTVAGHGEGSTKYFCAQGLVPRQLPYQPSDVIGAVRSLLARTDGRIRWVGLGALSNLAHVLEEIPEAADRLVVTQMGGGLEYRDPARAEHNIRMDVPSAHDVFAGIAAGRLEDVQVVTSDITFRPEIEIVPGGPVHRRLSEAPEGGWQRLLHRHLDAWFAAFHPGSMQHDALALSAAIGKPFVNFGLRHVCLDRIGRMLRDEQGAEVWLSLAAKYDPFNTWLQRALFD
ncbi:nucleoside hydrolase [Nocardiopsis sp. HNM0947]|uniref:Nucleoside hydrolase n=1 Tax=Nocardiopsis coralli TaxID=2772213 RepID=A0ABR9P2C4_9ACTN|nr:nucleoside hydrolase [Nocardiopsis coralli]MBE2997957.1 nucleoside hydrolase [Nocardiopsis coralli]